MDAQERPEQINTPDTAPRHHSQPAAFRHEVPKATDRQVPEVFIGSQICELVPEQALSCTSG